MLKNIIKSYKKSSLIEKVFYLYILILPIDAGNRFLLFNKKVQYSDILFPILFLLWCLYKFKQKSIGIKRWFCTTHLFIAFFLIVTLCSFINSINLIHSLIEWIGLLYLAILFLMITDITDAPDKFRRLLAAYSLSAIIAVLVGLGAFLSYAVTRKLEGNPFLFFWAPESSLLFLPRIKSFFYTTNMFATFEHIGLVTTACVYFSINKNRNVKILKILLFTSFIITAIAIFLAGSQTLAGVLLTIFMVLCLFKGRMVTVLRYAIFIFTFLVMIFVSCATIWMIYPVKINNDFQNRIIDVQVNYAYSHHIIPSIYAVSMFKKYPLLGVGIGTFADQYPKYIRADIEKLSSARMQISPDRILDPHNTYTGALAEWGLLGFMAMIALFIKFITMLFPYAEGNTGIFSRCLLAGLLGFLFNALFIDIMMMRHFWIFLAMVFIFYKNRKEIRHELKI